MIRRHAVLVALSMVFMACATPYQTKGFRGGYSDTRVDSNTVMVSVKGNAYTDRQTVQTYLLRRCAEVTLADGYDYFVFVSNDAEEVHGAISTPGSFTSNTSATAIGTGNMAFGQASTSGTFYPGQSIPYTKHRTDAMIKMFKGSKPVGDARAFDAHELARYIGAQGDTEN